MPDENALGMDNKHRKRKKKLLNQICEQLQFYFSDANLRHDRFLRKEIEENNGGYVDLTTMLRFNKLKGLTSDIATVAKAVKNSTTLELNDEKTKVKRKIEIPSLQNVDSKSVYVEQLPSSVDHDWLKNIFSQCGSVDYISLPRYKHNNKPKGFAFVEFATTESAKDACKVLNTANDNEIKDKKRNQSTDQGKDKQTKGEKSRRNESNQDINHSKKKENLKRKLITSESSSAPTKSFKKESKASNYAKPLEEIPKNEPLAIKDRTTVKGGKRKTHEYQEDVEVKKSKKAIKNDAEDSSAESNGNGERKVKKKNRQHKKKKKECETENVTPSLYVITKLEWLSFKKQYKNIHKKEYSQLKATLRVLKSEKVRKAEVRERIKETKAAKETQAVQTESAGQKDDSNQCDMTTNEVTEKTGMKKLEVALGTVLLFASNHHAATSTRKELKECLSPYDVAYVDYIDGGMKGHVRFKTSQAVDDFLLNQPFKASKPAWYFERLDECAEKSYFEKAARDQELNYENNEKKKKRKRGKEKIMKRLNDV